MSKEQTEVDWSKAPAICTINGSRWLLGPETEEEMTWEGAILWCHSKGGVLPPRDVLLHAYLNEDTKKKFTATGYWSSTELSATNAWYQDFGYGGQYNDTKISAVYARAVKKLTI